MNKRIAYLKQLIADGKADSFARYAYALELKKEGTVDEALAAFESLRSADPQYLPQYLIAGQMLLDCDRVDEAKAWLEPGLQVAQSQGDGKAVGEIEAALASV